LASDKALRQTLDCRWVFIPCIDTDGTRLNEGWFKTPFDTISRFKNHYSPPGNESTDFAFPADENFDMNDVPPPTRALIRIIARYRPQVICTLHNIPFAGAHWYVNRDISTLFDELYEVSDKIGIPINMGEPSYTDDEVFRPGIYKSIGDVDEGARTIHILAYYRRKEDGLFLVPEVPLYYGEEIADLSDSGRTKRDIRVAAGRRSLSNIEFLNSFWTKVKDKLNADSVFFPSLRYWLEDAPAEIEEELDKLERDAKYLAIASVSEAFSHETIRSHNRCYTLGNFLRLLGDSTPPTEEERRRWAEIGMQVEQRIVDIDEEVRRENKLVFPSIRNLIRLQTASLLLAVQYD